MQPNTHRSLWIVATLLVAGFVQPASAQIVVNAAADTPESAALRGGGQFLRGAGWYNLNTARAAAINLDTEIRWAKEVRQIHANNRADKVKEKYNKKLKEEEIQERLRQREDQLRKAPTQDDIHSGDALNILLCDLMDPQITSEKWQANTVPLPKDASVKNMVFKFVRANGASQVPGVIALSRLNVARTWPTALDFDDLKPEKSACEAAFASVRKQVLNNEFKPDSLKPLDKSLDDLQARVPKVVQLDKRGFQPEALRCVKDLRDATRMFDARTVDYAKEILLDTEEHDATTVAELVAFALKFRLQFASAQKNSISETLYPSLFEVMRKQVNTLGIQPEEVEYVEPLVDVETIVKSCSDEYQRARKKMLDSFDNQIAATNKNSKLKSSEKKDRVAFLKAEKKNCVNNGSMPFSPTMRADAITYVEELKAAQTSALDAMKKLSYEGFVSGEKRIAPVKVGKWRITTGPGPYDITLNSDGTTVEKRTVTWTIDGATLKILWHMPGRVAGDYWIDTGIVDEAGMQLTGQSQLGHPRTGTKLD